MRRLIKGLIKAARMTSSDDSFDNRRGVFQYQGQDGSLGTIITPYGHCSNPPNNSLAFIFSQNGQDSNAVALVDDPKNRFRNLKKGEVAVGNYTTRAKVLFDEGGNVEIDSPDADVTITAGRDVVINAADDITINGDNLSFNITGTSTFTIGGTSITIDSSGITVTSGDIVADGISLKSHLHTGVQAGGSNTGGPI